MPRRPGKNYLRKYRLQAALTVRELGALLGVAENTLVRYELGLRPLPADVVLASAALFGVNGSTLFPALYNGVEEDLLARAQELGRRLADRPDLGALKKRQLMSGLSARLH